MKKSYLKHYQIGLKAFRDPAGARTQDPNIKSVVLYLLSYRVILDFPLSGGGVLLSGCKSTAFFVITDFFSQFFFIRPTILCPDE